MHFKSLHFHNSDLNIIITVTEALVFRPPTRRPMAHHTVNPYPGTRRQNETEMFSDHDETRPSIIIIFIIIVAYNMLLHTCFSATTKNILPHTHVTSSILLTYLLVIVRHHNHHQRHRQVDGSDLEHKK